MVIDMSMKIRMSDDPDGLALNLNTLLVPNPVSTYYLRADGDAMTEVGIKSGDILVVDRSIKPHTGDIVVATVNGEFILRQIKLDSSQAWLSAEGESPIALHEAEDAQLWGVVTFWVHKSR
jgi:DNA polymerase V